jgi:L-ascorbate metabolism protein UlaG (beta-lactamase superfamily)
MLAYGNSIIHIDPYGQVADYARLPAADVILVTHEHGDHLDLNALAAIRTPQTEVVWTETCSGHSEGGIAMRNGDVRTVKGVTIEAVPAYNMVHRRGDGQPFHPKGRGNGYILSLSDTRVYVAGDTENTPEMKGLREIDVAFLPMNLPYTMTPEMVADAAKAIQPRILYPYHYGSTDTQRLVDLLADEGGIEVRVRNLQ